MGILFFIEGIVLFLMICLRKFFFEVVMFCNEICFICGLFDIWVGLEIDKKCLLIEFLSFLFSFFLFKLCFVGFMGFLL